MAVDIEMKLFDIQERYRTLAMYKVEVVRDYFLKESPNFYIYTLLHILLKVCFFIFKVGEDERELNANISQIWDDLFKEARQVDLSLADVKKSFSLVRHHSTDRNWPIVTQFLKLHYTERSLNITLKSLKKNWVSSLKTST